MATSYVRDPPSSSSHQSLEQTGPRGACPSRITPGKESPTMANEPDAGTPTPDTEMGGGKDEMHAMTEWQAMDDTKMDEKTMEMVDPKMDAMRGDVRMQDQDPMARGDQPNPCA